MAGAFSGHLLHAFNNSPAGPSSSIVTSGAMSFDARAHGTPAPSFQPFSPSPTPHALFGFTPFSEDSTTAKQIATLQAKLNKKLGPEYISQRPGPGGGPKLTYAEGWKIINLANEVFGFNGWSSSIVNLATDFIDYNEESKRFNVGVTAIVRVTLRDGAYHEDVGYGVLENGKSKAAALDKCKKEAITDALKRTLRNFGNLLGNCLYDKSYAQEVVKIKVPPAKLDKNELYRRPEFEERISDAPGPTRHAQTAVPETPLPRHEETRIKVEHESHRTEPPITYVPRHLRQEMAATVQQAQGQTPTRTPATPPQRASTSGSGSGTIGAPANCGPPADGPKPNGLVTPIQTPARVQRPPPPRAPPPRAVATSPLARMPSAPERSVSFAEPMPMPARAASVDTADRAMPDTDQINVNGACNDDDDAFPLSTQDDAFLATVDLGVGDLGRPIDFDEGMSGMSMLDASELEPELELDSAERSPAVLPQPEHQVRDRAGSESNAGFSSGGPSKMNARNEAQAKPAAKPPFPPSANIEPNVRASGGQVQPRSGPSNAASAPTPSTSSMRTGPPAPDTKRPRPTTSTGGFHFPPGMKPPMQHNPKPVAPACLRTSNTSQSTGPTSALKRSADVMQAGSSTRPPIQGMGLAQRQQQHQEQQQNASARRPSDTSTSEGHDPKRLKR